MTDGRITRSILEAPADGDPDGRVTRAVIEAPLDADPDGRVTRAVIEAPLDADPDGRVTRVVMQVIASVDEYVPPPKDIKFFEHLLPRGAKAWLLTKTTKYLRKLFEALVCTKDDAVDYLDAIWLDMFPAYTRELTAWEATFGLDRLDLTEAERRERLAGLWAATGGQDPRYFQNTLQAAGFNAYVHEWWEVPAASPPVARNPYTALGGVQPGCGDPDAECGEPIMECGNSTASNGYMLVNKIYTADLQETVLCGEALAACGEAEAECGENSGVLFDRVTYPIPPDPDDWPYIFYVGGQTFGDTVSIAASRREEFEDLILKIKPAHLWVGLLVDYESLIIEDATGYFVIEDASSDQLVEVL